MKGHLLRKVLAMRATLHHKSLPACADESQSSFYVLKAGERIRIVTCALRVSAKAKARLRSFTMGRLPSNNNDELLNWTVTEKEFH